MIERSRFLKYVMKKTITIYRHLEYMTIKHQADLLYEKYRIISIDRMSIVNQVKMNVFIIGYISANFSIYLMGFHFPRYLVNLIRSNFRSEHIIQ